MPFKIEEIDRAIEWALRDEVIRKGYWPDQRAALAGAITDAQWNILLDAMSIKIDVFGVGEFEDREQLKPNNIIIERESIYEGAIGYGHPFRFDLKTDNTFSKIKTADGTSNMEYEVRFVCDDVILDRVINMIMINTLSRNKYIYGIREDLTAMDEGFWIARNGNPVDVSGGNTYIERVYRFIVTDVLLDEETVISSVGIIKEIGMTRNVPTPANGEIDARFPEKEDDGNGFTVGVTDYFLSLVEGLSAWEKFQIARLYANDTQVNAVKNLKLGYDDAVNTSLIFTPYKGFVKSGAGYLNTKFPPSILSLSSYSYAIFVTDAPQTGIAEYFGLIDGGSSFYLRVDNSTGIQVKANSNTQVQLDVKIKPNTLYVINRRNRFRFEIFEGESIIGELEADPTAIPAGNFAELGIFNQSGTSIGVGIEGGIGFSAIGSGLNGSEIRDLNTMLIAYFTKIGIIPLS